MFKLTCGKKKQVVVKPNHFHTKESVLQTQYETLSAQTIQEDPTADRNIRVYHNVLETFLENVLWTDETTVELFGKAHHFSVYRKQNEAYKEKNAAPTGDNGGGSKMFCCLQYWEHSLCVKHRKICRLPKDFWAEYRAQCPRQRL